MRDDTPLLASLAEKLGQSVTAIRAVIGGGYTPAERLVATLDDGSTVFVKRATDSLTAGWIRQELFVYRCLGKTDFTPRFLGGGEIRGDNGEALPYLVLEDLSGCHWPPPWSPEEVHAVQNTLTQVQATRGGWMQTLPRATELSATNDWKDIARDPVPFLSLGLCSSRWLDENLPLLGATTQSADFSGSDLLHCDIRSDNICFRPDGRACIVDWNWAMVGNGALDTTCWLPSLSYETGIIPERLAAAPSAYVAWFTGYLAARAGLPLLPLAPHVRRVQQQQLSTALPWICRLLDLPPPL